MWVPKHRADTQVRPYGDRTHNPSLTCPGLRDYKTAYPAIPRRHAMKPTYSTILAIALFFLTGCASSSFMYKDISVSKGSAEAGAGKTVAYRGLPLKLDGTPISTSRGGVFGRASGLLIPALRFLARTGIGVDKDKGVRCVKVVPQLASMPAMGRAFEAAPKVAGLPPPASAMSSPSGSMGGG